MLYADAAKKVLDNNGTVTNGKTLMAHVYGREYESKNNWRNEGKEWREMGEWFAGMQGFKMRINENGDAEGNYTLLTRQFVLKHENPQSPDYYPNDRALIPSAFFVRTNDSMPVSD